MTTKPRLVAVGGPEDGREYPLDQAEITVGRDSANTLTVAWDGSVSRRHGRIVRRTGLFWLEDLNSKRGTSLTLADGVEHRVPPHDPTLLLDGAWLRLGFCARFQVLGVIASNDDAVRLLLSRLQQEMKNLYGGLPHLPPESRDRQRAQLQNLEARLQEAQSEAELLRLAAEVIPTLSGAQEDIEYGPEPLSPPSPDALPALPDALPDPGDPNRLKTILNVFIADIRACFPGVEGEEEGTDE